MLSKADAFSLLLSLLRQRPPCSNTPDERRDRGRRLGVASLYNADPDTLDERYGPLPANDMIVIEVAYEDMMDPAESRVSLSGTSCEDRRAVRGQPDARPRDVGKVRGGRAGGRLHGEPSAVGVRQAPQGSRDAQRRCSTWVSSRTKTRRHEPSTRWREGCGARTRTVDELEMDATGCGSTSQASKRQGELKQSACHQQHAN
eukprot:COSAG06_NODE_206_length_20263_cov_29.102559_4_plen_202_part_00